jgi:hypothetical protein
LVFATDRSVPLKELMPRTEEYYFFHMLQAQLKDDRVTEAKLFDEMTKSQWITGSKAQGNICY